MRFRTKEKKSIRVEVTPLIDVIFLLLIFFMISTTFITNPGIKVNLPQSSIKSDSVVKETPEISVSAQNIIFLNGKPIHRNALGSALRKLIAGGVSKETIIIKADEEVKHKIVVFIMDLAKRTGFQKLSIATRPPNS